MCGVGLIWNVSLPGKPGIFLGGSRLGGDGGGKPSSFASLSGSHGYGQNYGLLAFVT